LLRDRPATDGELLIPPTVQAMVASRLDGLPPEHRDLARRLSVYRYDFDLEEVSTVAQAGEDELQELIDERSSCARRSPDPHRGGGSATRSFATWPTPACRNANGSASIR